MVPAPERQCLIVCYRCHNHNISWLVGTGSGEAVTRRDIDASKQGGGLRSANPPAR
jgi:hypothetical protein